MARKTIAHLLTTAALVVGLALLPACMQTEESAKIEKSGKGLITIKTVVDKAMTEGLVEMMQGMGMAPGGASNPTAQLDPERIKESLAKKEGVEVRSATRSVDEESGKITVNLEVAFDTIEALYKSGAVMGVGAKLEKLDDGNYRFTRSFFAQHLPKEDDLEGQQMFEGILMMLESYLAAMEFTADMWLPTAIVETNGEKVDEKHVRWSIRYQDLMKASKRTQTVVFSGEGLDWKPFESEAANPLRNAEPATPTGPITPSDDGEKPEDTKPDDKGTDDKGTGDEGADDAK